jgi:hypothetical protein
MFDVDHDRRQVSGREVRAQDAQAQTIAIGGQHAGVNPADVGPRSNQPSESTPACDVGVVVERVRVLQKFGPRNHLGGAERQRSGNTVANVQHKLTHVELERVLTVSVTFLREGLVEVWLATLTLNELDGRVNLGQDPHGRTITGSGNAAEYEPRSKSTVRPQRCRTRGCCGGVAFCGCERSFRTTGGAAICTTARFLTSPNTKPG